MNPSQINAFYEQIWEKISKISRKSMSFDEGLENYHISTDFLKKCEIAESKKIVQKSTDLIEYSRKKSN